VRRSEIALSLAEQAAASGFTFVLFWTAARVLDLPGLELYTALFSLNQSFGFFLFGLVLQPMASAAGEDAAKQLGTSVVLLIALLVGFAVACPLAMGFLGSFEGQITTELWALSVAFFVSQSLYEAGRWLTIRLEGVRAAASVTMARFALFFGGVAGLGAERLDGARFVFVQIGVNGMAILGFALLLRRSLREAVRLGVPDQGVTRHVSNFGTSVANFVTNFATVALVDRGLGAGGLAAFQALRSATNPVGLLSQVFDNHFSADLARAGRGSSRRGGTMRYALVACAVLVLIATALGPRIVQVFLGDAFVPNWVLLPLLLTASLAHALTRPTFVKWRIAGDTRALNLYSMVLVVAVLPGLLLLGWTGRTIAMVTVFALLPATALAVDLLHARRRELTRAAANPVEPSR
jgi:O-antigen/teichoic acid export membrane protein